MENPQKISYPRSFIRKECPFLPKYSMEALHRKNHFLPLGARKFFPNNPPKIKEHGVYNPLGEMAEGGWRALGGRKTPPF